MADGFLKPPSAGMWLVLVSTASVFASQKSEWEMPATLLFFACVLPPFWFVSRWVGRCVGTALGWTAREFAMGWRDGREKAERQRRGDEPGTDALS